MDIAVRDPARGTGRRRLLVPAVAAAVGRHRLPPLPLPAATNCRPSRCTAWSTSTTTAARPWSPSSATRWSASPATTAPPPIRRPREFAVLVEDAWQGHGLGRQLLVEVLDLAARRGVRDAHRLRAARQRPDARPAPPAAARLPLHRRLRASTRSPARLFPRRLCPTRGGLRHDPSVRSPAPLPRQHRERTAPRHRPGHGPRAGLRPDPRVRPRAHSLAAHSTWFARLTPGSARSRRSGVGVLVEHGGGLRAAAARARAARPGCAAPAARGTAASSRTGRRRCRGRCRPRAPARGTAACA